MQSTLSLHPLDIRGDCDKSGAQNLLIELELERRDGILLISPRCDMGLVVRLWQQLVPTSIVGTCSRLYYYLRYYFKSPCMYVRQFRKNNLAIISSLLRRCIGEALFCLFFFLSKL